MNEGRLLRLLVTPSLVSSIMAIVAGICLASTSAWLYVNHNALFYDYLFGPYGIKTALLQLHGAPAVLQTWLFGSQVTYYVLLTVTAIITGLTVLTTMQGIQYIVHQSEFVWHAAHASSQIQKNAIHELFARLVLRVLASIAWGMYTALFITVLIPFVLVLQQDSIDALASRMTGGSLGIMLALVFTIILMHMHVVFVRLVMLRPRLYGISDIELAEYKQ